MRQFLALICVFASLLQAVPTVTAKGTVIGTNTQTISVTASTGDYLIVVLATGTGRTLTALTWNGIAINQDVSGDNASGDKCWIGSLYIASGATANVSSDASGSNTGIAIMASTITGMANATVDKFTSATGSSTTPSSGATATLTQADEVAFGAVAILVNAAVDGTWSNSYTNGQEIHSASNLSVNEAYLVTSATTAQTAAKTGMTSRQWAACVATYKQTVAPGPGATQQLPMTGVGAMMLGPPLTLSEWAQSWFLLVLDRKLSPPSSR